MKLVITTVLCLLLLSSTAIGEEPKAQRFTEQVIIDRPTLIKVVNMYGDIRIRRSDGDEFIYHGVAQVSESQKAWLEFNQTEDQITAELKFSDPDAIIQIDRYDLAIVVPETATLDIKIERGKLSSKGLKNDIKVRSKTSDIELKTTGSFDLLTERGYISLDTQAGKEKNSNKIQTFEGSVTVKYHKSLPYFKINTGSYISSNSSELLNSKNKQLRTALFGDVNSIQHIQITTDTGAISLIDLSL